MKGVTDNASANISLKMMKFETDSNASTYNVDFEKIKKSTLYTRERKMENMHINPHLQHN